jgi:hypothetical protein
MIGACVAERLLTDRAFFFAEGVEEGVDTVCWRRARGLLVHGEVELRV